mmetsp:Transcript_7560/g.18953  ORF Transcript_7560/g.18953 Transcript_7560/m.18953 type:complete len:119 (-) Transcript_7560:69-425(-)
MFGKGALSDTSANTGAGTATAAVHREVSGLQEREMLQRPGIQVLPEGFKLGRVHAILHFRHQCRGAASIPDTMVVQCARLGTLAGFREVVWRASVKLGCMCCLSPSPQAGDQSAKKFL